MAMEEYDRDGEKAEALGRESDTEGFDEPTEFSQNPDTDASTEGSDKADIEAADEAEAVLESALDEADEDPTESESSLEAADHREAGSSEETASEGESATAETDMEAAMEEDIAGSATGVARRNPTYTVGAFDISLRPSPSQLRSGVEEADWFEQFRQRLFQQQAQSATGGSPTSPVDDSSETGSDGDES